MFWKHFMSLVQFLITLFTVAMTLILSGPQNNSGKSYRMLWCGQDDEVKYLVSGLIAFNVILLCYNFISNSYSRRKLIERQVALINNIAKLAFELVTNEKKFYDLNRCEGDNVANISNSPHSIRILVLIHYKNSWYRKIILFCYCLRYLDLSIWKYFNDRFITIAGYNHPQVITEGIPFNEKSTTGKAFIEGKTICELIGINNELMGSSNRNLKSVLATPITYNGSSVGTLNIDSSEENSSVCSMDNSETIERFAKIIADIIGSDVNGYRSYVAKRYRKYILNTRKVDAKKIESGR